MVAAEEEACLAGYKCGDTGDVVFQVESHTAEAGLEYDAHIQYQDEQEIHRIGYLLEEKHDHEVNYIQNEYGGTKDDNFLDIGIVAVEVYVYQHG